MNITEKLVKNYWMRRISVDNKGQFRMSQGYKSPSISYGDTAYVYLTQADLLNEIEPSAHKVNSLYMSKRPIYAPTGEKDGKTQKEKWKIVGYDDVESVSLGLQQCFAQKKTSHFAGDGFGVSSESPNDEEKFSKLMSYKDIVGLDAAFREAMYSCATTGDAAIYLYVSNGEIDYKVFSYRYGDELFPDVDENRNPVLYRKYILKGKTAVDIFTTNKIQTWVQLDENSSQGWLQAVQGWFKKKNSSVSMTEDGFTLVSESNAQVGNDLLQVIYFRWPDIPSGVAQQTIETLERACSYISEEVKSSAFPILFLKSEKIVSLPPSKINGKTIGVKGTSETVKNSDAKFLAPPDASNIASVNIKTLTDNILRTTMSVFIEPEILKSGADSSTTIKILYAPEIQWCMNMWPTVFKELKSLMSVFKRLVGKVENDFEGYADMKLSVWQKIWIPQNESERIKNELDQFYARVKSRKAVMQDLGNQYIGDYEQIIEEWEKELEMKARIPAEAKAKFEKAEEPSEDDNPNEPQVDNRADGKSITE